MSQAGHEIRIMAWTKSVFTGMWAKGFECCPSGWWFCVKDLQQNGVFLASTRAAMDSPLKGLQLRSSDACLSGILKGGWRSHFSKYDISQYCMIHIERGSKNDHSICFFSMFLPVNCSWFPFQPPEESWDLKTGGDWRFTRTLAKNRVKPLFFGGCNRWFLGTQWVFRLSGTFWGHLYRYVEMRNPETHDASGCFIWDPGSPKNVTCIVNVVLTSHLGRRTTEK